MTEGFERRSKRVPPAVKARLQEAGLWQWTCERRDELKAEGLQPPQARQKAVSEALTKLDTQSRATDTTPESTEPGNTDKPRRSLLELDRAAGDKACAQANSVQWAVRNAVCARDLSLLTDDEWQELVDTVPDRSAVYYLGILSSGQVDTDVIRDVLKKSENSEATRQAEMDQDVERIDKMCRARLRELKAEAEAL